MESAPEFNRLVCVTLPGADGIVRWIAGTCRDPDEVGEPGNYHGDPLVELPIDRVLAFRASWPFMESPDHPWPPVVDTGYGTTVEEVAAFALSYPDDLPPYDAVQWDGRPFELADMGGGGGEG